MNNDNGSRKNAQWFEYLIAWQKYRILVREICQLTSRGFSVGILVCMIKYVVQRKDRVEA